jgi:hypothetical protein
MSYTLHGHKLRIFTLREAQFVTGGIIDGILRFFITLVEEHRCSAKVARKIMFSGSTIIKMMAYQVISSDHANPACR